MITQAQVTEIKLPKRSITCPNCLGEGSIEYQVSLSNPFADPGDTKRVECERCDEGNITIDCEFIVFDRVNDCWLGIDYELDDDNVNRYYFEDERDNAEVFERWQDAEDCIKEYIEIFELSLSDLNFTDPLVFDDSLSD